MPKILCILLNKINILTRRNKLSMKFLAAFTPRTSTFFLFHSIHALTKPRNKKKKTKMKTMPLEKRPGHVCKSKGLW